MSEMLLYLLEHQSPYLWVYVLMSILSMTSIVVFCISMLTEVFVENPTGRNVVATVFGYIAIITTLPWSFTVPIVIFVLMYLRGDIYGSTTKHDVIQREDI